MSSSIEEESVQSEKNKKEVLGDENDRSDDVDDSKPDDQTLEDQNDSPDDVIKKHTIITEEDERNSYVKNAPKPIKYISKPVNIKRMNSNAEIDPNLQDSDDQDQQEKEDKEHEQEDEDSAKANKAVLPGSKSSSSIKKTSITSTNKTSSSANSTDEKSSSNKPTISRGVIKPVSKIISVPTKKSLPKEESEEEEDESEEEEDESEEEEEEEEDQSEEEEEDQSEEEEEIKKSSKKSPLSSSGELIQLLDIDPDNVYLNEIDMSVLKKGTKNTYNIEELQSVLDILGVEYDPDEWKRKDYVDAIEEELNNLDKEGLSVSGSESEGESEEEGESECESECESEEEEEEEKKKTVKKIFVKPVISQKKETTKPVSVNIQKTKVGEKTKVEEKKPITKEEPVKKLTALEERKKSLLAKKPIPPKKEEVIQTTSSRKEVVSSKEKVVTPTKKIKKQEWENIMKKDSNESDSFYDARYKITSLIAETSYVETDKYNTDPNFIILLGRQITNKYWKGVIYEDSVEVLIYEYINANPTLSEFFLTKKQKEEKEEEKSEEEGEEKILYNIYDNGFISFIVQDEEEDKKIYIYVNDADQNDINTDDEKPPEPIEGDIILGQKYKNIFIGDNSLNLKGYKSVGEYKGNSILVHVKGKQYIFIGSSIYSFTAEDKIINFYSPVKTEKNYDVESYPYAIGEEYVYLLGDQQYIVSIDRFNVKKDIPAQFVKERLHKDEETQILKKEIIREKVMFIPEEEEEEEDVARYGISD